MLFILQTIQIRSYPTFSQLILSPPATVTSMKYSLNGTVLDELTEAMTLLVDDPTCKAVMISGMGGIFCQGVDLTLLACESSADKQRRAAEQLSTSVAKFVRFLAGYPKLTVAGVNGDAVGLGVTLLPFFDLVYASDKAVFRTDYARLGQVPEGFVSATMLSQSAAFSEVWLAQIAFHLRVVSSLT